VLPSRFREGSSFCNSDSIEFFFTMAYLDCMGLIIADCFWQDPIQPTKKPPFARWRGFEVRTHGWSNGWPAAIRRWRRWRDQATGLASAEAGQRGSKLWVALAAALMPPTHALQTTSAQVLDHGGLPSRIDWLKVETG